MMQAPARIALVAATRGPRVEDLPAKAIPTIAIAADMAITLDDGSVDHIDAGEVALDVPPTALPALLAECRRVLRPAGRLACHASAESEVARFAPLVGLHRDHASACAFVKPERRVDADPLVSIVIPAHAPRFFAASLASAVGQTWEPLEIVVCDDSGGGDIERIARQAARQRAVRHVRNRNGKGTRANMALGLREARGEFVKYLNDDDLLAPDCVATLVASFREAPDVVLASSCRRRIDEEGRALPDQPATMPIADRAILVSGVSLANAMLVVGLNIVGEPTTAMFRRSDFPVEDEDPFAFDGVAARGLVDMTMWASLLPRGNAVWHAQALSGFRIHPGQSQRNPDKTRRSSAAVRDLQNAWLALGFPAYLRATEVLARAYPPVDGDRWRWHEVPALSAIGRRHRGSFASDAWRYAISYIADKSRGGT
jgi:hypothetical protein